MSAGMCAELSDENLEAVIGPEYREKDIKVYLEPSLVEWLEDYAGRIGLSRSQAARRLMLLGKKVEANTPSVTP